MLPITITWKLLSALWHLGNGFFLFFICFRYRLTFCSFGYFLSPLFGSWITLDYFLLSWILFVVCFWVLACFFPAQILFLLCSYYLHLVYFLFMNRFTTFYSYDTLSLSIRNSKLSKLHFYLQFLENLMLSKINIGRRFSTKKPGNNLTLMASS